jgi:hypothetical protein
MQLKQQELKTQQKGEKRKRRNTYRHTHCFWCFHRVWLVFLGELVFSGQLVLNTGSLDAIE